MNRITGISPLGVSQRRRSLIYLLRDEFTTPQAAPLTSPRTCEPGPGTLTITDTANNLSISSGSLVVNGFISSTNPLVVSGTITRASGIAVFYDVTYATTAARGIFGFNSHYINAFGATFRWNTNAPAGIGSVASGMMRVILRSAGAFGVIGDKLVWVDNATSTNQTTQISGSGTFTTQYSTKYIRVSQLSAPWNDDFGIATNRVASPVVDTTTTSEANAIIEMTWQAVTGQTWELSTRRTDDNNRWIVRCDQAGGTIKLIERNAGVETERSSAAQTWTNGTSYRLVVIQDGNTINTYVSNVAKNTYTSATFNNSATGVKTNRAGTNLVAYPRTLSGAALTELQRWTS